MNDVSANLATPKHNFAAFALDIYEKPTVEKPGYLLWMGTNHGGINTRLNEVLAPTNESLSFAGVALLGRYGLVLATSQESFDDAEYMSTITLYADTLASYAKDIAEEQNITFNYLGNVIQEHKGRMAQVMKLTVELANQT